MWRFVNGIWELGHTGGGKNANEDQVQARMSGRTAGLCGQGKAERSSANVHALPPPQPHRRGQGSLAGSDGFPGAGVRPFFPGQPSSLNKNTEKFKSTITEVSQVGYMLLFQVTL